ncbi:MAG: elongation factor P maturation arginine rhamnosyltransferase EarP [Rhodocyclaceae bacterium]|nr:elongation factor P maturation arginine rhamnosyltransferase EarP [Rhodocyclaceae bacterium]
MSPISCDIFCTVIDNLGDAGVCWRLARQLATEHHWRVRLWIDDPTPIALLAPEYADLPVEVSKWEGDFANIHPARIVIEAFACELPPRYVEAMAALPRPPVWINLEYLSAEDWVAGCHGLPSPHPPLLKHFFFPGFVPGTGGLLREHDYAVPSAPTFGETLEISLFCYANLQLPALLDCWRDGDQAIACHVAEGLPRRQVETWLGKSFPPRTTMRRGNLSLDALPFLPQTEYDTLLARCLLNFVRGEDSFVRAQWAERPFVWQAYPQAEGAHLAKLDAFLNRYAKVGAGPPQADARPPVGGSEPGLRAWGAIKVGAGETALCNFWHAWNGDGALNWQEFSAALPALAARAPGWARQISAHGDLATNLVKFCLSRL